MPHYVADLMVTIGTCRGVFLWAARPAPPIKFTKNPFKLRLICGEEKTFFFNCASLENSFIVSFTFA